MGKAKTKRRRKPFLILSICFNLGMLGFFKYTNFFGEIIASLLNESFKGFNLVLPVGISFFTFQSMSYTIDVYRGNITPLKSWLDYAFYVSFFPPLVAGPIVRAKDFIPQIRKPAFVTREMFGMAVFLIITGLFKKAIISNYISANFVDRVFDNPGMFGGLEILFGLYGYAIQIYCDFSGYSDMAIGIALLLGFKINPNFNSPYKAQNITDFWRRWHISLSSWLRDYLYISLGGNRKGKIRTYINLIITMLLGGLWHGASLRFILWGAVHGVVLALHKFYRTLLPKRDQQYVVPRWRRVLNIFLTFHFVVFVWILFRSSDMEAAGTLFSRIFTHFHPEIIWEFIRGYAPTLIFMAAAILLHFSSDKLEARAQNAFISIPLLIKALIIVALIVFIFQIKSADVQPFIYFNF
jgi:D-alanyl-lipoteichoic acid acyltransferase DltB (MBOAT superfamily)